MNKFGNRAGKQRFASQPFVMVSACSPCYCYQPCCFEKQFLSFAVCLHIFHPPRHSSSKYADTTTIIETYRHQRLGCTEASPCWMAISFALAGFVLQVYQLEHHPKAGSLNLCGPLYLRALPSKRTQSHPIMTLSTNGDFALLTS